METENKINRFTYLSEYYIGLIKIVKSLEEDRLHNIVINSNATVTGKVKMCDIIFEERALKMYKDMALEVEIEIGDYISSVKPTA